MRFSRAHLPPALRRFARALVIAAVAGLLSACSVIGHDDGSERADGPPPTVYTVERGDTLYSIAWRHDLAYREVAAWNDIPPPYTIYPGQKIRLRPPVEDKAASGGGSDDDDTSAGDERSGETDTPRGTRRSASGHAWEWPATGEVVSGFGAKDYGKKGVSIGGDYRAPIRAAEDGRVVYSGNGLRGYGNLVIVKHGDTYLTAYGYNDELLVGEGETVAQNDVIARMGRTPDGGTAVHFELRRDGKPVNPLKYLPKR